MRHATNPVFTASLATPLEPRERWLVISNCQVYGLAHSLFAIAPDLEVEAMFVDDFRKAAIEGRFDASRFQRALIWPNALHGIAQLYLPDVIPVPTIMFGAYHPDCVYVALKGSPIHGAHLGPYHSLIVLAAYKEGLGVDQAVRFFNEKVYKAVGYLDQWIPQRDRVIGDFDAAGINIRKALLRWSRGKCFMHTPNHPKIDVLRDIVELAANKVGVRTYSYADTPADNLAGTSWPVYPEIGSALGVAGDYLFRPSGHLKPMDLKQYVADCLGNLGQHDPDELSVDDNMQSTLVAMRAVMRGAR